MTSANFDHRPARDADRPETGGAWAFDAVLHEGGSLADHVHADKLPHNHPALQHIPPPTVAVDPGNTTGVAVYPSEPPWVEDDDEPSVGWPGLWWEQRTGFARQTATEIAERAAIADRPHSHYEPGRDEPWHVRAGRAVTTVNLPAHDLTEESVMTATRTSAQVLADERKRSQAAFLAQSPTTTPSFPSEAPTGAVPALRPNPGMLRALLQPILFFTLTEPLDAFETGDTVALQFWGEGRVMVTPLPAAAARGRIPTTFPANKIHGFIAVPREDH